METSDKISYVLYCSSGIIDSYQNWIEGVFDSLEKAESEKKRLMDFSQSIKDKIPSLDNEYYYLYQSAYEKWITFSEPKILPFVINQPVKTDENPSEIELMEITLFENYTKNGKTNFEN